MAVYGDDIYTEPEPDFDTLANLGPLRAIAGVWEGTGNDEHPNIDGTWSYEEEGQLQIPGNAGLFHHTDRSTLTLVASPTPNPLARHLRRPF